MDFVSLPSARVKAALDAAIRDNSAEGERLAAPFRKHRSWSWRKFRMVDCDRGDYCALSAAKGSQGYFWFEWQRDRLVAAASSLYPLCAVSDTVNVSSKHLITFKDFYK